MDGEKGESRSGAPSGEELAVSSIQVLASATAGANGGDALGGACNMLSSVVVQRRQKSGETGRRERTGLDERRREEIRLGAATTESG
jgi:hypothetical protein